MGLVKKGNVIRLPIATGSVYRNESAESASLTMYVIIFLHAMQCYCNESPYHRRGTRWHRDRASRQRHGGPLQQHGSWRTINANRIVAALTSQHAIATRSLSPHNPRHQRGRTQGHTSEPNVFCTTLVRATMATGVLMMMLWSSMAILRRPMTMQ